MPEISHTRPEFARPRTRHIVTTMLMIALSIMIVRDILVRRLGRAGLPDVPRPPT